VLFRRKLAPPRYEELDPYFASDQLSAPGPGGGDTALPESDLLKALHSYASDFYSRATPDKGRFDFRSMDETALLAFGILMEEACRESLGETGDMVFVEGNEDAGIDHKGASGRRSTSVIRTQEASGRSRRGKKRRLNSDSGGLVESND
jgi:hypothetical protein